MSDKEERFPFQYGPRDNGPADPPPWPDLTIAVLGLLVSAISFGVGMNFEWIGDLYVRGPCGFLCIIGLMFGLSMVGDGFDKARAEAAKEED